MIIKIIKMTLTVKVIVTIPIIITTIKCRARYRAHNNQHGAPCDIT